MIADVTFERTIYNSAPNKFEAGTASIADAVGLGAAPEYLSSIGMPEIIRYEHELVSCGMKELAKIKGLHLIGTEVQKLRLFVVLVIYSLNRNLICSALILSCSDAV